MLKFLEKVPPVKNSEVLVHLNKYWKPYVAMVTWDYCFISIIYNPPSFTRCDCPLPHHPFPGDTSFTIGFVTSISKIYNPHINFHQMWTPPCHPLPGDTCFTIGFVTSISKIYNPHINFHQMWPPPLPSPPWRHLLHPRFWHPNIQNTQKAYTFLPKVTPLPADTSCFTMASALSLVIKILQLSGPIMLEHPQALV